MTTTSSPSRTKLLTLAQTIMALFWLLMLNLLCIIGLVGVGFLLIAIGVMAILAYHRRFGFVAFQMLTNPISLAFFMGLFDYSQGSAALRYSGLPGTKFHNLDRNLRCGNVSYGCIVDGSEWISQAPYNSAVFLLTSLLGPMPGTYLGPYPTELEAKTAVANGMVVSPKDLMADRLLVGSETIVLDEGVGTELLERLQWEHHINDEVKSEIKVALWQEQCAVLRIPSSRFTDDSVSSSVIVLFSRANGRPFAYYGEGNYSHHFPPVPWKRRK